MLNIDDRILDRLNESETFLCLQILRYMKPERMTAWPSMETLCKACGWSPNTFRKHRKSLIEKGVLSIEEREGEPHIYSFKVPDFGVFISKNDPYQNLIPLPEIGVPKIDTPPLPKIARDPYQNLVHEEISKEEINTPLNAKPEESKTKPQNDNLDDVTKMTLEWATADGLESVKNWYTMTKNRYDPEDLKIEVLKFCSLYLTTGDTGRSANFKSDPVKFFKNKFVVWLTDKKSKERATTQTQQQKQNGYSSNYNKQPDEKPVYQRPKNVLR